MSAAEPPSGRYKLSGKKEKRNGEKKELFVRDFLSFFPRRACGGRPAAPLWTRYGAPKGTWRGKNILRDLAILLRDLAILLRDLAILFARSRNTFCEISQYFLRDLAKVFFVSEPEVKQTRDGGAFPSTVLCCG